MRIFISHASEQHPLAEELAAHLRQAGHRVDVNFEPGEEFTDRIRCEIKRAHLFVFLVSEQSVTPGRYTLSELEFANKRWPRARWHILPVLVTPVTQLPSLLKALTYLTPKGNLVAETADVIADRDRQRLLRMLAIAVLTLAVAAALVVFCSSSRPRDDKAATVDPSVSDAASPESTTANDAAASPRDLPHNPQLPTGADRVKPKPASRPQLPKHVQQDALATLVADPSCKIKLARNASGYYLTCVCSDSAIKTSGSIFVGRFDSEADVPREDVVARAKQSHWTCP